MFSKIKAALSGLMSAPAASEPPAETVEYNGYRITPAPYRNDNGQYQTAGSIEKDGAEGVRQHKFVRADSFPAREDAINFTTNKAKQIIDLQGDRIFG